MTNFFFYNQLFVSIRYRDLQNDITRQRPSFLCSGRRSSSLDSVYLCWWLWTVCLHSRRETTPSSVLFHVGKETLTRFYLYIRRQWPDKSWCSCVQIRDFTMLDFVASYQCCHYRFLSQFSSEPHKQLEMWFFFPSVILV